MDTIVETRYGEVRGGAADGVNTFKGIFYAAPPVRTLSKFDQPSGQSCS